MIFIVDDDASVRKSLTRLMRSAGYEAWAFATAQEFLAVVDAAGVAAGCVILDLHMAGMNGLDLQKVINRREPPVPVIILSATEDTEQRAPVAAGAKVLRKPCDSSVLLRAVAEGLGVPPPDVLPSSSKEEVSGANGGGDPESFILAEGHAQYRPAGSVSFDKTIALVRAAIAAAGRNNVKDLLVDTTALTGFASPDTFQRFLAAVEWAEEAQGGVRLAMVALEEMIHPQKLGVLVAANRGMVSNIFPTEVEARAWLGVSEIQ